MRQTRCQRCYTECADGKNSLAAVHPELVVEWGAEANVPLRADAPAPSLAFCRVVVKRQAADRPSASD